MKMCQIEHCSFHPFIHRARRRRVRENKSIVGHHDGVSSDDEQNQSEIMKFNQERGGDLYFTSLPHR